MRKMFELLGDATGCALLCALLWAVLWAAPHLPPAYWGQ